MNIKHSFYAIIVAGGNGKRMESDLPKQFIVLNGKPILMHTINAFSQNIHQPKIILVLAKEDAMLWQNLVEQYQFNIPHLIVYGGKERFHSVKNALEQIKDNHSIVAIHDAVRPLVSQQTISNCFVSAQKHGNAVAAVPAKDSVRRQINHISEALVRSEIFLVQTPQTFKFEQLYNAYSQDFEAAFTDDASVVEKAGFFIQIEKGDDFNLKLTFKEDLLLAEAILKARIS